VIKHGNRGLGRRDGNRGAQFTAAEKNGKGMALRVFTGAKPSLKARMKHFQ
jgi:hypothetical protein